MKLVAMGVSETGLIPQTSIFVHGENGENSLHFVLPCFPITPFFSRDHIYWTPKMGGLPSKTIIDHEDDQFLVEPIVPIPY